MKKFPVQFAILILALAPFLVRAGGDEVVVVYNSRLPESKAVAEHYASVRQVPENHIYGFALTTNESVSRPEFHDTLQMPLAKKLEADKLWQFGSFTNAPTNGQPEGVIRRVAASKIRYAVLCYGVPLKISPDQSLREVINTNLPPQLQRDEAAVDSELAWLPLIEMKLPITGPLQNWAYGATNTALLHPTNGILLVARLDGPTADIARGLVDKALQAERDGLWGRAYFDARGLTRSQTNYWLGDEWILGAAQISRALGFETVVDDKPETFPASFPLSQIALYAGWYAGDACGPFQLPQVEFMPGAFAYHLHSSSAATIRSASQCWVGPMLARGATCTMGCVYEPYLVFTPNVALFLERFTIGQFTFGEAAWAAQPTLSWQTTVVGDPLYRPFGKAPMLLHHELTARLSPLIEWSFLRLVNVDRARGVSAAYLANLIETTGVSTNSAVLAEKLADLYAMQGKASPAIDAYERALTLNPSPEQRIRIRLTLADKLLAQDFAAAARRDYQKLLEESPDYPGKAAIEEKIKALEQKLPN
ncbi:MAG: TIGR03790 family protein, partial [Verrucomicrobiota bacterium]